MISFLTVKTGSIVLPPRPPCPLLIVAEVAIDPALRGAICDFVSAGLVQEKEMPSFEAALEKATRLRDSKLTELVLFILAFAPIFLFVEQEEWLSDAISTWRDSPSQLELGRMVVRGREHASSAIHHVPMDLAVLCVVRASEEG